MDKVSNKSFPHSLKLWIVFEIVAEKFKPHFKGEKYETVKKNTPLYCALRVRDDLLKKECDRQGEYNGHYTDTPM